MADISFTQMLQKQELILALSKYENNPDFVQAGFMLAAKYDMENLVPDQGMRNSIKESGARGQAFTIAGVTRNNLVATNTVTCSPTGLNADTVLQNVEYKDFTVAFSMENTATYKNNTVPYEVQLMINTTLAGNALFKAVNAYCATKYLGIKAIDANITAPGSLNYTIGNDAALFTKDFDYRFLNEVHQIYQGLGAGFFRDTIMEDVCAIPTYDFRSILNEGGSDGSLKTRTNGGTAFEVASSSERWVQQLNRYKMYADYGELAPVVGTDLRIPTFLKGTWGIDFCIDPAFNMNLETTNGTQNVKLEQINLPMFNEYGLGDIPVGMQKVNNCEIATFADTGLKNFGTKDTFVLHIRTAYTNAINTDQTRMPSAVEVQVLSA